MSDDELRVVESSPFQRLRQIRQLALSHLVYHGATHTRFEHSLGVMELAGRAFDVVTSQHNLHPDVRERFAKELTPEKKAEWRKTLRFAALCHDLGHLPFSHAGEGLLPKDWKKHDSISVRLIMEDPNLREVWKRMEPLSPDPKLIAQIAVGTTKKIWNPLEEEPSVGDPWKDTLSEIIVGDSFGVDRMDFLLRDAYYTGVPNGVFDHWQLIESLRILPDDGTGGVSLGLVHGGLRSAEAMMMARYFMYRQVYYHRTRKIYDFHLQQFLKEFLKNGEFSVELKEHQRLTDIEIWGAIKKAAKNKKARGHLPAWRIISRKHFKCAYEHNPRAGNFDDIAIEVKERFKEYDAKIAPLSARKREEEGAETPSFLVLGKDEKIYSVGHSSELPEQILDPYYGYVFADESIVVEVKEWCEEREVREEKKGGVKKKGGRKKKKKTTARKK